MNQDYFIPIRQQMICWLLLVFSTSLYYYLYDRWHLLRDVQWLYTLWSTAQGWLIWLLLMPWLLRRFATLRNQHGSAKSRVSLIFNLILPALVISTVYQYRVFSEQPAIVSTLVFCYLPANLKILALLMALPWISKTLRQRITPAEPNLTLRCQDHRNQPTVVNHADISHITADGNYLQVHAGGQIYTLRCTMKSIQSTLGNQEFIRIHRSHLVNQAFIKQHNRLHIVLINDTSLPIGRSHLTKLTDLN